jgi:hypothetical protein
MCVFIYLYLSLNLVLLSPVTAVILRVGLLGVIKLNFSLFHSVCLKRRKFCQPFQTRSEKQYCC